MKDDFSILSSFQVGTVCFFRVQMVPQYLFHVCATVQCIALVLWTSVIYGLLCGYYN